MTLVYCSIATAPLRSVGDEYQWTVTWFTSTIVVAIYRKTSARAVVDVADAFAGTLTKCSRSDQSTNPSSFAFLGTFCALIHRRLVSCHMGSKAKSQIFLRQKP
eukprot:2787309-Amphidinium_carterae.1